jgi:hypothetical protein
VSKRKIPLSRRELSFEISKSSNILMNRSLNKMDENNWA